MEVRCEWRPAKSLVEVLVVVAILGLLVGLVVSAVQKVRMSATHTQSINNLRQLILATHQVAGTFDGFAGGVYDPNPATMQEANRLNELYPLFASPLDLAYLTINGRPLTGQTEAVAEGVQPLMVSPADPSAELQWPADQIRLQHWFGGPTSYAYNMSAFVGPVKFPDGVADGASQTIAYCERYYSRLGPVANMVADPLTGELKPRKPLSLLNFSITHPKFDRLPYGNRRASFADAGWGDVVPVTDPTTRVTRPSRPGATFQVRPMPADADMYLPQTPFSAGLPVAMFDGSVRTVRPGVAPEAFWAAVTPAGGEVASLD